MKKKRQTQKPERLKLEGTTLYIRVPGELDHHSADEISRSADRMLEEQNIRRMIFDFSDTGFCDSSGIGMLMGRYKMMKALGGEVRAVQVGERVAKILMLSGIMKIIPVERAEGGMER